MIFKNPFVLFDQFYEILLFFFLEFYNIRARGKFLSRNSDIKFSYLYIYYMCWYIKSWLIFDEKIHWWYRQYGIVTFTEYWNRNYHGGNFFPEFFGTHVFIKSFLYQSMYVLHEIALTFDFKTHLCYYTIYFYGIFTFFFKKFFNGKFVFTGRFVIQIFFTYF